MNTAPPATTVDPTTLGLLQARLVLEAKRRNGINWFYWIAGLSLLNTVIFLFGGSLTFVVGLAATQFVDGFMSALAADLGTPTLPLLIAFILDLIIAGVFVAAGYLGRKGYQWVVVAGMGLYLLDALLLVVFQEWLAVAFHAYALWGLWQGLQAIQGLKRLEAGGIPSLPMAVLGQPVSAPLGSPRTFRVFVIAVVGVAACFLIPFTIIILFPQLLGR